MSEKTYPLRYGEFRPVVEAIIDKSTGFRMTGEGREFRVWDVRLETGRYAVKIAREGVLNGRDRPMNPRSLAGRKIEAGIKALGIVGLEQFETGSEEDAAVVYRYATGTNLTELPEEDASKITAEQVDQLIETAEAAARAGIVFDTRNPSGANAFYSPTSGFTLLDYEYRGGTESIDYEANRLTVLQSIGPVAYRFVDRFIRSRNA